MEAIKVVGEGRAEIQTCAIPKLRPGYILVKVEAVALNPTDWKHIDWAPISGATVGCDYAGVVEAVGEGVSKQWNKGDRIAGLVHGVNKLEKEDGCFGQYAVAVGDVQMMIPTKMSMEEASTLGVGVTTVGQALYQSLGLPLPTFPAKVPFWILVYGGSTATGSLAIQYAKLSGLKVVTTCGRHNFDYVKSLGADAVFDYKEADCGSQIRALTEDKLRHVFDCISEGTSPRICCDAISSSGGTINYLDDELETPRTDVTVKNTLAYTMTGEAFDYGEGQLPPAPEDLKFGVEFWKLSTDLFAEGKVKVHKTRVCSGGLKGIFEGLEQLKAGKVSGVKLVYRID